jgi:hypothetical protein
VSQSGRPQLEKSRRVRRAGHVGGKYSFIQNLSENPKGREHSEDETNKKTYTAITY